MILPVNDAATTPARIAQDALRAAERFASRGFKGRLALQCRAEQREVPVIKAFPLLLLRGTKLDHDRQRWGLIASDDPMARVESSDTFSPDDWRAMAALSEALKATEGAHPDSIEGLWEVARGLEPDLARWSPVGAAS